VVAADMLAESGKKLNTFTAVPEAGFLRDELPGRYFDETPYVHQIAKANPNIVPHFIPPSKGSILDQIAEQIRLGGAPSGSILNGLWVMDILAAARSAGHNVMLVGEMGNLTMSYSGVGLFAQLLRTGRWLRLFREIKSSGRHREYMIRHWTIAPFIPAPLFRRYKRWRRGGETPWHDHSLLHPEFATRSGVVDRAAREHLPFDAPPPRDNRWGRVNDFNSYCESADWFTKLRAGFGIDTRTPALDRRLVEFCIGIPEDQYLHNGFDRWLIRRAMKGRLPDSILQSTKRGAQAADWHPRLARERDRLAERV
jgi:asparagine synthase (glutamine-hydrolysing)